MARIKALHYMMSVVGEKGYTVAFLETQRKKSVTESVYALVEFFVG